MENSIFDAEVFSEIKDYIYADRRDFYLVFMLIAKSSLDLRSVLDMKLEDIEYTATGMKINVALYENKNSNMKISVPKEIEGEFYEYVKYSRLLNNQSKESYVFVNSIGKKIHPTRFSEYLKGVAIKFHIEDLNCRNLKKLSLKDVELKQTYDKSEENNYYKKTVLFMNKSTNCTRIIQNIAERYIQCVEKVGGEYLDEIYDNLGKIEAELTSLENKLYKK